MSRSSLFENEAREGVYNGFDLRVEDLIVWVPESRRFRNHTPRKAILKGVNAEFARGTMTAIVGPSGSGKTTLLNFLAGRQDSSQLFRTSCRYFLNGVPIRDVNQFKNIIGYVLQEDILEPRDTPRRIFTHYARLRGFADPAREASRIVSQVYLQKCENTVVGDAFHRGLSGGEKKRTSVGVELVSKPNLLFLDEPTTGLDSTTALDIIMNVAELRKSNMTIICTIHQPSEEIMACFDRVIMLVDGQVVFNDAPANIAAATAAQGFTQGPFETPIEHLMKVVDKDEVRISLLEQGRPGTDADVARVHAARIANMAAVQDRKTRFEMRLPVADPDSNLQDLQELARTKNAPLSFGGQFGLLFGHYSRLFFTDFRGLLIKTVMFWLIFALVIVVFVRTPSAEDDPVTSIQNYAGLLFMLGTNFFMAGLSASTTTILPAKAIFRKDRQSRLYSSLAFFAAVSAAIIPFYLVSITAVTFPFFFVFRFNFDPWTNLLWFWAFLIMSSLAGMSLGLVAAAIAERFDDVGAMIPILILPMMTTSGFFANIFTITWPLRIYSYVAPFRFIFQGLVLNHVRDPAPYLAHCRLSLPCLYNQASTCVYRPPPQSTFSQSCDPFVRFNFEQKSVWLNFVILCILFAGWRAIAFLIFWWRYRERGTRYSSDPELESLYAGRLTQDKEVLAAVEQPVKVEGESGLGNPAGIDGEGFLGGPSAGLGLPLEKAEGRRAEIPESEFERLETDARFRDNLQLGFN